MIERLIRELIQKGMVDGSQGRAEHIFVDFTRRNRDSTSAHIWIATVMGGRYAGHSWEGSVCALALQKAVTVLQREGWEFDSLHDFERTRFAILKRWAPTDGRK